jgi:hypothetical protein
MLILAYIATSLFVSECAAQPSMLISIATRGRPQQFFRNLNNLYKHLSYDIPYRILISCDIDDESMNNATVIKRLESYPSLEFNFGANKNKIEACNRNIGENEFDILLAMHDDMQVVVKGFDKIIVDTMTAMFPDFDGVLNLNDGYVGAQCNTIPVVGRKFYDRFGYLYNPEYSALVANLELTYVSKILKKECVVDQVLIRHNHPAWNAGSHDDIYKRSADYYDQDFQTFKRRREGGFDISDEMLAVATPKLWSILICTIEGREESFGRLCKQLTEQINALGLQDKIEILACKDVRGQNTVGFKRNSLMQSSSGVYTQFVDDDDKVCDNFIAMIYERLLKKPDCVSLTGVITTNGTDARKFIHSIAYDHYFEKDNVYFRPPNHLNPIKRSIAIQFAFPEKNFGEDTDWAMSIADSKLLKTEEVIDTPYYFYLYAPANSAALP